MPYPRVGVFEVEGISKRVYFNNCQAVRASCSNGFGYFELADSYDFIWNESGHLALMSNRRVLGTQFHPELSHKAFDDEFYAWLTEK